ncbi:hypothetical protein [Chitinophaga pinensis]|uniref:Uncharacterized protein n=1 Tax=Chitinophaga pinensis (strain ATCC 43595 / DSM 2588 / LMG 13176 / NBRC 15968 / NCIMB 11800 / UQM 2034) TaxID=485918 RepID=A0A979GMH7_CHIPD|nr:hypothetical protein [Chitinophaga pinensis]ACU58462.1 conserved hypothetical protein [Chitinophaga pinensis DSM 2588]
MSSTDTAKPARPAKSSRKEARDTIEKKLDLLLVDLKNELGDTKFKNRIKKAAKLLSKGLDKKKKAAIVKKKATKKAVKGAKPVKVKAEATTKAAE